jgi:hypothetical protein
MRLECEWCLFSRPQHIHSSNNTTNNTGDQGLATIPPEPLCQHRIENRFREIFVVFLHFSFSFNLFSLSFHLPFILFLLSFRSPFILSPLSLSPAFHSFHSLSFTLSQFLIYPSNRPSPTTPTPSAWVC